MKVTDRTDGGEQNSMTVLICDDEEESLYEAYELVRRLYHRQALGWMQ